MRRPSVLAFVKERCSNFRAALLDAHVVTEEEIRQVWPGGPDNPGRDVFAWLHTYWNIARFMARSEARQEFEAGASPARSDQLLHLQQGTPRTVALLVPLEREGERVHEVHLHHKSFTSLRRLATYARLAAQLLVYIRQLEETPEHAELIIAAHEWRERILLMLIWGAIGTDAEGRTAGIPWNPLHEPFPELPAWLTGMHETDVLAVHMAYAEQYGKALLAVAPFITGGDEDKDPLAGWETFFASYATEKGLEAQHLMQDRAFLPFLTQVSLAAHSSRQARESAKAKSAAEVG